LAYTQTVVAIHRHNGGALLMTSLARAGRRPIAEADLSTSTGRFGRGATLLSDRSQFLTKARTETPFLEACPTWSGGDGRSFDAIEL